MTERGGKEPDSNVLRAALRACRSHFVFVAMFSFFLNLLYLAPSLYMLQVYDRVLTSGGLLTLLYLSIVLALSLLVLAALEATRMRLLATMGKRFDRLLSPAILSAALDREGRKAAGQANTVREFDTLRGALSGQPAVAAFDAPWAPIYILVCFMIHPWIGLLTLFGGALLIGIAYANQAVMHKSMRANDQSTGAMYSMQVADSVHGDTMRALGMHGALVRRQLGARETMADAGETATRGNTLFSSTTKFVRLALQSASLGLGAYLALDQQISAGGIIAAAILSARAFAPLETIVGAWRQFEQGRSAYATLNKVLKSQEHNRDFTALPAPTGRLSVEAAGVMAPMGDRYLLMGASFKAEPGEIIGVVGPSGAGKTTLMRVVAGATRPDQGAVRLDGAKLTDWQPDRLGRYIGYLPQEVALLAGTVADNISRFERQTPNPGADIDAAVIAAAQAAGAHEMILTLPRGYDTPIGHNGHGLSAGQAQRVALARALYRDPVLIVLDEPNAHLDHEGEVALASSLQAARARGATVIVVAHRNTFMSIADKLLVVQNGRIESFGPRDQVIAKLGGSARPAVVSGTDAGPRRP